MPAGGGGNGWIRAIAGTGFHAEAIRLACLAAATRDLEMAGAFPKET